MTNDKSFLPIWDQLSEWQTNRQTYRQTGRQADRQTTDSYRNHGLDGKGLHEAERAITLSEIMYASPAWWGYTNMKDKENLDRLIQKMSRKGDLPMENEGATELAVKSDGNLFGAICIVTHNM